ncbi:ribosomal protein L11 methyltransferase [Croceivirga lutea]|nr:ribosomal protein L11 methyltransferase [Croceivirga lutea]
MAELSELGFESFVETENGMLAYVLGSSFDDSRIKKSYIFQSNASVISWTTKAIAQQNWNAEWERSFQPIKVGDSCMVRAPFHPKEAVTYDIIIEPKMSFGTGHHETTHMMLAHILAHDFKKKTVLDMGCGTGVLAILAAMKGASNVDAIDIDEWCYLNSIENVERNNCDFIKVFQGDASLLGAKKYDVVLANINRNILLEDIPVYSSILNPDGHLFLSGFYTEDLAIISSKCEEHNLYFEKNLEKNNWISAKYVFSR